MRRQLHTLRAGNGRSLQPQETFLKLEAGGGTCACAHACMQACMCVLLLLWSAGGPMTRLRPRLAMHARAPRAFMRSVALNWVIILKPGESFR